MQGHAEFREIMESYFLFGGLPECVLLDTEPEKTCSLRNVRDSFRKVVITGDAHETPWMDQNGILFIGLNPTFHVRNESPRFARAFVRFLELSNKGLHYTPADAVCAASELTFGGGCAGSVSPSWFKRILTSSFGST